MSTKKYRTSKWLLVADMPNSKNDNDHPKARVKHDKKCCFIADLIRRFQATDINVYWEK